MRRRRHAGYLLLGCELKACRRLCSGGEDSETAENIAAWTELIEDWGNVSVLQPARIEAALRAGGVPRALRGRVWPLCLDSHYTSQQSSFDYASELTEIKSLLATREAAVAANSAADKPAVPRTDDVEEDGHFPTKKSVKQIRLDLHRG